MSTKPKKTELSESISIVAHQLKNPLSVIKGYIEILLSEDFGQLNEKQKEYLSDALETVHRMKITANHLLDVSEIEAEKFKVNLAEVDLAQMTQEIVESFGHWAMASNCKIVFEKPKDMPLVLADSVKIRDVIENLISNALKFKKIGQEGKIEISLTKKEKMVLFSCKDNGIGVAKEDLKKIFSKFYRSEKAVEMDPEGSGLGLYINKAIVELSGGKINFKSEEGKGSTFYLALPIAK